MCLICRCCCRFSSLASIIDPSSPKTVSNFLDGSVTHLTRIEVIVAILQTFIYIANYLYQRSDAFSKRARKNGNIVRNLASHRVSVLVCSHSGELRLWLTSPRTQILHKGILNSGVPAGDQSVRTTTSFSFYTSLQLCTSHRHVSRRTASVDFCFKDLRTAPLRTL